MVSYVSGSVKKTRDGKVNSMRTARNYSREAKKKKKKLKAKVRKALTRKGSNRLRLSQSDQKELLRACKKGYLTLDGRNAGHGSLANLCSSDALKGNKMAMAHRDWCDERAKPSIILYKASGRHSRELLDYIVVDLSPLREQVSPKWTTETSDAAVSAGMDLRKTEDEEGCSIVSRENSASVLVPDQVDKKHAVVIRQPISSLPFVSMGFFVGERSKAKVMAKHLAQLWELPELEERNEAGEDDPHVPQNGRYQNNHGRTGRKEVSKAHDRRRTKRRRIKRDDWDQSVARYMR